MTAIFETVHILNTVISLDNGQKYSILHQMMSFTHRMIVFKRK